MVFKIPFIQANRCLIGTGGVDKYTTLKTEKVREIGTIKKSCPEHIINILLSTMNIFHTLF